MPPVLIHSRHSANPPLAPLHCPHCVCLQLKKYGDKIDPIFSRAEQALESQYVNHIAKYVDKHGPAVLDQAMAQVRGREVDPGAGCGVDLAGAGLHAGLACRAAGCAN